MGRSNKAASIWFAPIAAFISALSAYKSGSLVGRMSFISFCTDVCEPDAPHFNPFKAAMVAAVSTAPGPTSTAMGDVKYGAEKSTISSRSGVMEYC